MGIFTDLYEVKKVLDIDGDGTRARMPPKEYPWQLNATEYALIKKWIRHGAPDFQGAPQTPTSTGAQQ